MIPLILPGLAAAQPPPMVPLAPPPPPAVAYSGALPDQKRPATALQLSVLGTGVGFGMMAAGASWESSGLSLAGFAVTLVGPSAGHFYAGETGRGLMLTGLRAGGVAAVIAGASWGLFGCLDDTDEDTCDFSSGATVLIAGGVALTVGSMVYSLYDAPRAARRENARARRLYLTPAPMASAVHASDTGFGLQLGGQF